MLVTPVVTIFTQETSTSCAIKPKVYFSGSLYTVKQNSQNQLLQYTPQPGILISEGQKISSLHSGIGWFALFKVQLYATAPYQQGYLLGNVRSNAMLT